LQVFAETGLLVEREGVSLGDASRQILPLDLDPLSGDLKRYDHLGARRVLLAGLGADGDDAVAHCVMGAGRNWVTFGTGTG
jgi:hypothetical protein